MLAVLLAWLTPALAVADSGVTDIGSLVPSAKHVRTTQLITQLIRKYHYKRVALDNTLSVAVLDQYLEALDPNRSYFLAQDVQQFKRHRYRFDDYLRAAQLKPAFAIFTVFRKRVEERTTYARSQLEREFDFERDEDYRIDRRDDAWPATHADLDDIWRKRVKNDILSLRLTGMPKAEILDTLRKRYERLARSTAQANSDDVFSMFMNAYVASIEPHTAYFSPRSSENFRIRMSLSLEGIGAVLQLENEYTLVRRVVPGGPAELSEQLHGGDRIVGVGQGVEPIVDVIGWRLDDVVDLIRGPKGTLVRLRVLPKDAGADGATKTVSIVRNKIKLEEQAAQKSIQETPGAAGQARIGIIELPTFYVDFDARARGESDYRSTTRDVKRLLLELMNEDVDGIIVDLRGNGGGSLSEATSLTGLFIESGPIVQVRDTSGSIQVNSDPDPSIAYNGPLAVLVDRNSASASEIFAGAIQDYGRGLVVGEPTFGKGTVQNLINLDDFADGRYGSLGQLKVTIAQFFRINGDSTQHRGVVPDIVFPTAIDAAEHGERALSNALPWATVRAARYAPHTGRGIEAVFRKTRAQHETRIRGDEGFRILADEAQSRKEVQSQKTVSLHEGKRRSERARTAGGLDALSEESSTTSSESAEDETPDIILAETSRILVDYIETTRELIAAGAATSSNAGRDSRLITMTPRRDADADPGR